MALNIYLKQDIVNVLNALGVALSIPSELMSGIEMLVEYTPESSPSMPQIDRVALASVVYQATVKKTLLTVGLAFGLVPDEDRRGVITWTEPR